MTETNEEKTKQHPSGLRVKDLRIARGLSQEELGDLLGIRQEAISSLERLGPRRISTAIEVAAALDVSPSFICFGEHSAESLIEALPDLAERITEELERIETEGKSRG